MTMLYHIRVITRCIKGLQRSVVAQLVECLTRVMSSSLMEGTVLWP